MSNDKLHADRFMSVSILLHTLYKLNIRVTTGVGSAFNIFQYINRVKKLI